MRRDAALIVTLVASLGLPTGCKRKPPAAGPAVPPGPQITVLKPEMRPVKREVELPGTVMAFDETILRAKLTAYVGSIEEDPEKVASTAKNTSEKEIWLRHDRFIDIGSRVKKDQILARLSIPELDEERKHKEALVKQVDAEVKQAEKAHAATVAGVTAAKAGVLEADAGVDRAQALVDSWQKEVARVSRLLTGGVGDSQTRDETHNQFKAAEATLKGASARVLAARAAVEKAEADRDKAAADVDAAKARVDVARAAVGEVKARQSYVEIRAPFDGVVTRRPVTVGDFVTGGDRAVLFSVARIDPVRVVVQVPEADAGLVVVGQTVQLALQTGGATSETGTVSRTSWSLDPGSRTLRTEIDLPNPKGLIRPGTYAYAKLTAELPAAWSVPAAAVGKINDEPVIYLAEGGKAVRVRVELLRGDSQFTQVRRYRKPGATNWTDVTGSESVATPASALADGQSVP